MSYLTEMLRGIAQKALKEQEIANQRIKKSLENNERIITEGKLKKLEKKLRKFYENLEFYLMETAQNGEYVCTLTVKYDRFVPVAHWGVNAGAAIFTEEQVKALPSFGRISEFCSSSDLKLSLILTSDYPRNVTLSVSFEEPVETQKTGHEGEETMDESMNLKLLDAFDKLSDDTNFDTGVYLGKGRLKVMEKSLDRILPQINECAKQIDPLFIIKNISEPDANDMCIVEIGYED